MRTYLYALLFACCCLLPFTAVYAQKAEKMLQTANAHFDNYNYTQAIATYRDILLLDNLLEAKIKLAECYRLTADFAQAEYWYKQIMPLVADPVYKLRYGQVLQSTGRYAEARVLFAEYARLDPWGEQLVRGCDLAMGTLSQPNADHQIVPLMINTAGSDFGAIRYANGIIFCSDRRNTPDQAGAASLNLGGNYLDLYYSARLFEGYEEPQKLKGKINSAYNDGPANASPDGTILYFTRNVNYKKEGGGIKLGIFESRSQADGKWGDGTAFQHNNTAYSLAHPTLSADGQNLYFVSDMPGGFGGTDLYICTKIDTFWSQPINLGATVNTPGNEMFPFLHPDGTLYFASDGLPGLGGLDIFQTQRTAGKWAMPRNMGSPINSFRDDFGLTLTDTKADGYFASNRSGGFGSDDLYYLRILSLQPNIDAPVITFTRSDLEQNNVINERLNMAPLRFKAGEWTLLTEMQFELDKVVKFMNNTPYLNIELAAHTDSRGDDYVNLEISQKRADAALQYIYRQGIQPARMKAVGYGETQPIEGCYNDNPCPDELYDRNNRLEVRITEIGGTTITPPPYLSPAPYLPPPPPDTLALDSLSMLLMPDTLAVNPLDTLPALQFKIFIGPYKEINNTLYFTFAELNTPMDMQNTDKGMMVVLGPYATITEAEQYQQYAKERGAKNSTINPYTNDGTLYAIPTKKLKKMGLQ
ncbi:MAG: OmpA family protein [Chitinophagales bacterium]|nr:OmpA family protein [Chitinophagales bacterium]